MGFWDLSTGEALEKTEEFDSNTFTIIPDKTKCAATIERAAWSTMSEKSDSPGEEYIEISWRVSQPNEYKNLVVFQKVRICRDDDKQRDKAIRMFAAIDTIADGGLMELDDKPTDRQLDKALKNKRIGITVGVWDFNGSQGNFVTGVEKLKKESKKIEVDDDDVSF